MKTGSSGSAICLVGILSLSLLSGACGSSGGAGDQGQAVAITNTQLFVTVQNQSGLAMREVKVAIIPVGAPTEFVVTMYRMENGEKRDFSLGDFRGRDGTQFNMRVVRPKSIKVTATDINNKAIEVESPWK